MGLDIPEGSATPQETARLIQQYRARRWIGFFVVLVVLFVLSGTTTWFRDALTFPLELKGNATKADVVIVLGAGTKKTGDHLPLQAKQRVVEGVELLHEGIAPRIIMSGGTDMSTKLIESVNMKSFATDQHAAASAILTEERSTSTFENAKYSLAIMAEHHWSTAVVVTSPYHTWRSCRIFRHQGANVVCVSAPWSLLPATSFYDRLMDTKSVVREYGAIVYNWAKGQL